MVRFANAAPRAATELTGLICPECAPICHMPIGAAPLIHIPSNLAGLYLGYFAGLAAAFLFVVAALNH
ncbi:hypothetical protein GCM10027089_63490 [Nocardia thraciensis]